MADWTKNEERFDDQDRIESKPAIKLQMLAKWVKEQRGVDPRGGGWSFVAKVRVIDAMLKELPPLMRVLAPKFSYGDNEGRGRGDVVFTWEGVPIRARARAKGDILHAVSDVDLPRSDNLDRREAAELRMRWHRIDSGRGAGIALA